MIAILIAAAVGVIAAVVSKPLYNWAADMIAKAKAEFNGDSEA